MVDSMNVTGVGSIGQPGPGTDKRPVDVGSEFKDLLLKKLNEVNDLVTDSQDKSADLLSGKTDNVAEVMVSAQKAEMAFQQMMAIRNKILDAYNEIQQVRI